MIEELQRQITELTNRMNALEDYSRIPLATENALLARGFTKNGFPNLTGIVLANGASAPTAITPLAGSSTVFVAATSGGGVTTAITFTNGVRTT